MTTLLLSRRSVSRRRQRGAAMVEFAITAPIFVMLMLYSMYFVELVRTRIKLMEASRYAVWEMSSYDLSKYGFAGGSGRLGAVYDEAFQQVKTDVEARYKDLDSVEDINTANGMFPVENFEMTMEDQTVEFADTGILQGGNVPGGQFVGSVLNAVGGGANWALGYFGFNSKGRVQVSVKANLVNKLFPAQLQQRADKKGFAEVDAYGGRNLGSLEFRSRFTMTVDPWTLTDGSDAVMRSDGAKRAGAREEDDGQGNQHGLHAQVQRMRMLGLAGALSQATGGLSDSISQAIPSPLNTFVVSHNYKRGSSADCGEPGHKAGPGMNNLAPNSVVGLDEPDEQRCFDTVPFRDTHEYANSRYRDAFAARGEFGFGCWKDQSTEPTSVAPTNQDEAARVECGPADAL